MWLWVDSNHLMDDRRVVSDASFYILPDRLTILIWTVLPAPYRYTEQVLVSLITRSHRDAQPIYEVADIIAACQAVCFTPNRHRIYFDYAGLYKLPWYIETRSNPNMAGTAIPVTIDQQPTGS
jgi:hypothetical protein